jgi:carbon monoxide dehydrogenase subunit G
MPSAQRTIVIDRPADQVFAFFTDHTNDRKWRPGVKEIAPINRAPVGTRIHQVVKGPGGMSVGADIEVTANDPSSRYAFQVVSGPVRPRGEFQVTPSGNGTEVRFSLNAELGGITKLLMSGSVQSSMESEMAGLDTAKRVIESS